MLAAAGVKVTLVESRPKLLEFLDDEIAESLQFRLRDRASACALGESVASKTNSADGHVEADTRKRKESSRVGAALRSAGKATAALNLPAANLTADNRGRLKVNEFYQTEVPHIYAAGD